MAKSTFSPGSLVDTIHRNRDTADGVKKVIAAGGAAVTVIPKLTADKESTGQEITAEDRLNLDRTVLEELSRNIQSHRQNNKDTIALFPDVELAIQIMVASVLSPKKMMDTQLNYSIGSALTLPPNLSSGLIKRISEYVTEHYELEEILPDIVRTALYETGSYCMAVIPEASVDEIINSDVLSNMSTESFRYVADNILDELGSPCDSNAAAHSFIDSMGMQGDAKTLMKGIFSEEMFRITDNSRFLRFSEVKDNLRSTIFKMKARKGPTFATEAAEKLSYLDVFRKRTPKTTSGNVVFIRPRDETQRKSIGKPMTVTFPSASVIPVGIPGNEKKHVAYIVLTDENGRPLDSSPNPVDAAMDLSGVYSRTSGTAAGASQPIQTAYRNLVSGDKPVSSAQIYGVYKTILEKQLYETVESVLYGKNVKITESNDIYFMMFCRAIAGQKTNLVVIPKDLMVYFAFHYNDYGIGKSLMENLTVLSSLRAITLFSKVVSESKAAIDVTRVNVTLDPKDPDYKRTIRTVQDAVLKGRQNDLPIGVNNLTDIVRWLQRAGLQFNYSSVEGLPDTRVEFDAANIQHNVGNTDTEENLGKQMIKALGVPPELIDNAWSPDFATVSANNNIMLAKRVKLVQTPLMQHLKKLVGLYIYLDQNLRDELRKEISEQKSDFESALTQDDKVLYSKDPAAFVDSYLDRLSEHIQVKLPEPENTNLTNMSTAFQLYKDSLISMFDSVASSEIFGEDIAGKFSEHIETLKNVYIHHLLRQWCADNNYYPEALAFGSKNREEMGTMMDVLKSHLSSGIRNGTLLLRMMQEVKEAADKDLEGVNGDAADEASSSGYSGGDSSSESESGDTGGDDGMGGMGDGESGDDLLKIL